jgi:hypothetical protein
MLRLFAVLYCSFGTVRKEGAIDGTAVNSQDKIVAEVAVTVKNNGRQRGSNVSPASQLFLRRTIATHNLYRNHFDAGVDRASHQFWTRTLP